MVSRLSNAVSDVLISYNLKELWFFENHHVFACSNNSWKITWFLSPLLKTRSSRLRNRAVYILNKRSCNNGRHGIWKLRVHTFQWQYVLSDHLSILKWFWLISVPNEIIYHFYGTFFIMNDWDMTRVFL